jgi:hypothetical protein
MPLPLRRTARDCSPGRPDLKGASEIAAKGASPGELEEQAKVIMSYRRDLSISAYLFDGIQRRPVSGRPDSQSNWL